MKAKVFGMKADGRVDVSLTHGGNTPDVFWSRGASFVVAKFCPCCDPKLVSVNGIGEVRWVVEPARLAQGLRYEAEGMTSGDFVAELAAARHLGLLAGKDA